MKFLIWGNKGWIGGQLVKTLEELGHEAIGADSRADNEKDVEDNILRVKPDRCISLIGRTRGGEFLTIDYLEQKGKLVENMKDNLWGPVVLATICKKHNIHFVYLGTGCIFHYDNDVFQLGNGNGFKESSLPNFFGSAYSTVKGYTDRMMHLLFNESALNCRIRMPITPDDSPYNFITKIANYDKVVNVPNSMTVLPELLPKLVDMSVKQVTGTINLTNPGAISHNEVLSLYQQHVDPGYTWGNFSIEEQDKILLGARSNNLLDTQRLQELYPDVDDIHTAVAKVCKKIKEQCPNGIVKRRVPQPNSCQ